MRKTSKIGIGMAAAAALALCAGSAQVAGQTPLNVQPSPPPAAGAKSTSQAKAKPAAKPPSTPESRSAAALALSADPVFDEGTFQRMKEALLSYSAIQVRGGWPALPADAKLAAGASGPEQSMLRCVGRVSDLRAQHQTTISELRRPQKQDVGRICHGIKQRGLQS